MLAKNLYQKLIEKRVINSNGSTKFSLNGISINVNDVSIVGNIMQEWLEHFMLNNDIYFRKKSNTQEFPDFLLNEQDSDIIDLLEVKVFTRSPNFDIANFSAYARSLRDNSYRLNAKYLIFKYTPIENGITIDNIWLKNVWEICCSSTRSDVKIQWKQGDPVNIRPATWYSDNAQYKPFESRKAFVKSLGRVIGTARIDQSVQNNWLQTVTNNYQDITDTEL